MQHFRKIIAAAALMLIGGCAVSKDPSKLNLTNQAQSGVILIQMDPAMVPYGLMMARYNEAEQRVDADPFHGYVPLGSPDANGTHYVAGLLEPGTYVFLSISQQGMWAVCFQDKSVSFTIHAGEALYLGDLRPQINLAQLAQFAAAHGDMVSHGEPHFYFEGILPPNIADPKADLATAKAYAASAMPKLQSELQPAAYKLAKFGTGSSLFGKRVCGGYFKEKAKQ